MNGDPYTLKEWLFGAWLLLTAASAVGLFMLCYTLVNSYRHVREMTVAGAVFLAVGFDLLCIGGGSFMRPMSGGTYPFLMLRLAGVSALCAAVWYAYVYYNNLPRGKGGGGG